jgi:hypothetical protein
MLLSTPLTTPGNRISSWLASNLHTTADGAGRGLTACGCGHSTTSKGLLSTPAQQYCQQSSSSMNQARTKTPAKPTTRPTPVGCRQVLVAANMAARQHVLVVGCVYGGDMGSRVRVAATMTTREVVGCVPVGTTVKLRVAGRSHRRGRVRSAVVVGRCHGCWCTLPCA